MSRLSLRLMYPRLLKELGPQHWWPAQGAFEMMIGAILTQSTSWHNVEKALQALKQAGDFTPSGIAAMPLPKLEKALRPVGYFRQKARRVRDFSRWLLAECNGDLDRLFDRPPSMLRAALLAQPGVGPETADCILLYAARVPVFVVDAYTRRILSRHGWESASRAPYEELQQMAARSFGGDAQACNEIHALLVEIGKRYCRKRQPDCEACPLGSYPRTFEGV